jgi:DNA-binding NarL/FixJ family response regulator
VGIILSNHATPQHAKASAAAGAAFFLDKSTEFERIPAILSSIAAGTPNQETP